MKYVLDTSALSALMRADSNATGQLRLVARSEVGLPQPVVAEIQYGLSRLVASKKKARLEARWRFFASEIPRVPWTEDVSVQFGRCKAMLEKRGDRLEDLDLAIAAHALAFDAILVSENRKHFMRIPGLKLESWIAP